MTESSDELPIKRQEVQQLIESAIRTAVHGQEELAKLLAAEAVATTFRHFGVDVKDLDSMEEFRETLTWAKRFRKMGEEVGSRMLIAVVTVITGAAVVGVWAWIVFSITGKPPSKP